MYIRFSVIIVVIYIQNFYEKYVHWLVGDPRVSILL